MPQNENFRPQFAVMENMARRYSNELSVRVLEQEFMEPFKENYHVVGTPTLLILLAGQEKAHLLGLADQKTIMDFVSKFLK
jgi:hypothetical protein